MKFDSYSGPEGGQFQRGSIGEKHEEFGTTGASLLLCQLMESVLVYVISLFGS